MAKTIDEGFRIFHKKLTPSKVESQAAKSHRASIKKCLEKNFQMLRFFRTGSFGNGTSISAYSDVDYFASIPTENLKRNSGTSLRQVRDALDKRFPDTGVTIRSPAVLVPFGTDASESTEVVPADYVKKNSSGRPIYDIPDGSGGWQKSSPDAHNAYVFRINTKLGSKVKSLVRFLKAWKYFRNVPISSFYLELRVAKYAEGEKSIVYSIDVKNVLGLLWDRQLSAIQDPVGVSGYVNPCSSSTSKSDALSKLETALKRAKNARDAERAEDIENAFYWWNRVFAEKFPSY